ncbi:hypothetical protein SmJEL517_g01595 [Synchytrium microbalum]|uniref:Helicase C-terminal domain-containing protein n=1 Tax=Synchytrium microbalum TaxID=1806994 RepID=A0A507C9U5_9FUNG|nr:uncharacterized protein SmJEL517_g01595 [Synchytrium microbalum]TPX36118.1 hypothetical protein SmJEL517_g01595 [Synchytrium microbalum]
MDKGAVKPDDMDADVFVASIQTLGRQDSNRLAAYKPHEFKCVIIDEAHHGTAEVYRRVLDHFGARDPSSNILLWGCSATLRRHDGVSLGDVFQQIVYHKDVGEMIDAGWLCNMRIQVVATETQWKKNLAVSDTDTDFDQTLLSQEINNMSRNEIVVQTYKQVAVPDGRKATLVFATDVMHTMALVQRFRDHGIDARAVSSSTKAHERSTIISAFREGGFPVLVNCGILTEGADFPIIDSILLARPTRSAGLLLQMLGRGLRTHPDKTDCLVLDFVDTTTHGTLGQQQTAPTLLGLPVDFDLGDDDIATASRRLRPIIYSAPQILDTAKTISEAEDMFESMLQRNKQVDVKLVNYDNPFTSSADEADMHVLRKYSRNAWVRIGPHKFVLDLTSRYGTLIIDGQDIAGPKQIYNVTRRFRPPIKPKGGGSSYITKTINVCSADLLASAIRAADTYTIKYLPGFHHLRNAGWRYLPPSDKQMGYLRKFVPSVLSPDDMKSMTRGRACDLIVKLTSGARGHWKGVKGKADKKAKFKAPGVL